MKVEDEYLNVLMNIELAVLCTYHENSEMRDYDAEVVINTLIRSYTAQNRNKSFVMPNMPDERAALFDQVFAICELVLSGFTNLVKEDGTPIHLPDMPDVPVDVLILCLKRIRKSIKLWTKRNGPQGYLTFLNETLSGAIQRSE